MSRDMAIKFSPASKSDSYDKMSACGNCLKEPAEGKPFPVCSACKEASFCSKECQRAAWSFHRGHCQMRKNRVDVMANVPFSETFPPFVIRKRLLTDFIEVHECSFRSAFTSALILAGGIDTFPFDQRAMGIFLKYRPDCSENPAVAYDIQEWRWLDSAVPANPTSLGSLQDRVKSMPGYRGFLRVFFRIEDHIVEESYPQTQPADVGGMLMRAVTALVDHRKWFERVRGYVREGVVMRAHSEQDAVMYLGWMKMKKGMWVWEKLTEAELKQRGYPKQLLF